MKLCGSRRGAWRNGRSAARRFGQLPLLSLALLWGGAVACRTAAWPAADLAQPGWTVMRGQAVWTARRGAPEIAGELLWARRADGELFLEFQKTPFPLVTARWRPEAWQVEFVPQRRTLRGRGGPSARLGWLHLARALGDAPPDHAWHWQRPEGGHWRLENPHTGEVIEGFVEHFEGGDQPFVSFGPAQRP